MNDGSNVRSAISIWALPDRESKPSHLVFPRIHVAADPGKKQGARSAKREKAAAAGERFELSGHRHYGNYGTGTQV